MCSTSSVGGTVTVVLGLIAAFGCIVPGAHAQINLRDNFCSQSGQTGMILTLIHQLMWRRYELSIGLTDMGFVDGNSDDTQWKSIHSRRLANVSVWIGT